MSPPQGGLPGLLCLHRLFLTPTGKGGRSHLQGREEPLLEEEEPGTWRLEPMPLGATGISSLVWAGASLQQPSCPRGG